MFMNKKRKQNIMSIKRVLDSCLSSLENISEDEQDYFDNIPDNLQSSNRADISQDAIDELDSAIEALNSALDHLNNIL